MSPILQIYWSPFLSVISQRMANTKSALSLRAGDIDSVEQLNFVNSNAQEVLSDRHLQKQPLKQRQSTLSSSLRSANYLVVPTSQSGSNGRCRDTSSQPCSGSEPEEDYEKEFRQTAPADYRSRSSYDFITENQIIKYIPSSSHNYLYLSRCRA